MKNYKQVQAIKSFMIIFALLIISQKGFSNEIFSTNFNTLANWGGGAAGGYNEKFYAEGGWYFHSTSAVRGTAEESYGGSEYSFRDRDVFTVHNTEPVSGIEGFSFQLRDWMLPPGENRNLKISFDGGDSWETIIVINKDWFDEYQVYQEFIYYFPNGQTSFDSEEFMIELDGGGGTNDGRINIGQFKALGEATQVATPSFNPPGGLYFDDIEVTISTITAGADIYYTLDGSEPTQDDHLFTDPISVDQNTTIKARAFKDGLDASNVASAEYLFRILLLEKDFEDDDIHSGGWIIHDYIEGANTWIIKSFGGVKFAEITEYQSDPPFPHSWYISPAVDIEGFDDVIFTFESLTAFRTGDALSVHISENYTGEGDPANANWTTLPAELDPHTGTGYGNWTHSGNIDLSGYSGTIYIGFEYESDSDNNGNWQINNIFISASDEIGLSNDTSLATFTIANINVLDLGGLIVNDPESETGALLYIDDFTDIYGIVVEPNHQNAEYSVTINGIIINEEDLVEVPIEHNDVIVVTVTAEDLTTVTHYKVTVLDEIRELTILTPEEGDEFFTYDEVLFSWEATNVDQLILELFIEGFTNPYLSEIVAAGDGQYELPVPNGLHFSFFYRLTDYNDPGFYAESGIFEIIDNVDPSLTDKQPETGAEHVAIDTGLYLKFDELFIQLGEGYINVYRQHDDALIISLEADGFYVDYAFNEVFVTLPETLEHSTAYYILIDDNAFFDVAGNNFEGIDDPEYWTFTTIADEEPDDIICNGDFENWTDDLPDCWYGDKSNIGAANVLQYADDPHIGNYAVQLINASNDHRRFTSQATQVENGLTYVITFWVKGQGEIRTGLFDDRETGYGYAPYNSYITVNSDSWIEHSQVITAANTSSIAEFIFSLRNTNAEMSHLQLDHVSVEIYSEGPEEVATIQQLRNGNLGGQYMLTGEVILTFQQNHRNQKFIQDETAAIMMDDNNGIVTTAYDIYDGITGIIGTLGIHNQMLQFVPSEDPGPATSVNNVVTPENRTLESLNPDDQAKLVKLLNVTFTDGGIFETGQNYDLTSPNGNGTFRTTFFDADYIGESIPGAPQDLTVIVMQFMETIQVTARSLEDFEISTNIADASRTEVTVYPNPFSNLVFISGDELINRLKVLNLQGQIIENMVVNETSVSVSLSQLKQGAYFVHVYLENGHKIVEKIIKK